MLSLVVVFSAVLAADAGVDNGGAPALPTPPLIQPPPSTTYRTAETPPPIELKDAKDGTGDLLYEGRGFIARVAPDGSVSFKDQRVGDWSPLGFLPMQTRMPVPSLQSTLANVSDGRAPPPAPPSELDDGLPPPVTKQLIPDVSQYRPDTREGCRECSFTELAIPIEGFGRFDLADELTRLADQDPNRYQKAVFLAATRDHRIQMAVNIHAANVRRAAAELPAQLQAIACDPRMSQAERRAILVALGQEMDTTQPEGASGAQTVGTFVDRFDSGGVTCAGPGTATPN